MRRVGAVSLWPILSWISRLGLMYILICITVICLEISLTIFLVYYDTVLGQVLKETFNQKVVIRLCYWFFRCVPSQTQVIQKLFFLSFSSGEKFRHSAMGRPRGSHRNCFPVPLCQSNDQRSVVGQHRGKLMKEIREK